MKAFSASLATAHAQTLLDQNARAEALLKQVGAQEILDKPEAAAFLRIKKRTLDSWMRQGLPYIKVPFGGSVRFQRTHLIAFLAQFETKRH
jgi:Helix-turn-helix domain